MNCSKKDRESLSGYINAWKRCLYQNLGAISQNAANEQKRGSRSLLAVEKDVSK